MNSAACCCRVELCSTSYSHAAPAQRRCRRSIGHRAAYGSTLNRRTAARALAALQSSNSSGDSRPAISPAAVAAVGTAPMAPSAVDTSPSPRQLETALDRLDSLQREVDKLTALVRVQQGLLEEQRQQLLFQANHNSQQQGVGAAEGLLGRPAHNQLPSTSALGSSPLLAPLQGASWPSEAQAPGTLATPRPGWARISPFDAQRIGIGDRRLLGLYDSRFHSTSSGATPQDYRVLPDRIFLVRHAESEGNVDNTAYTYVPDSQVPLTMRGHDQARAAGIKIRSLIEQRSTSRDYKTFFYLSPYKRSLQTYEGMSVCFNPDNIAGVQEEVQLREQDFGNFQDLEGKQHEKAERLRFGRFFYRFPNGESGADVYDRITIFEDHMVRDINAGRFANKTNLVLVTHGLALRVFLMRWFHWTLAQYLMVHNPPNAEPLVLERVPNMIDSKSGGSVAWMHTKTLYRLDDESMRMLRGVTSDMCHTGISPRAPPSDVITRRRP